MPVPTIIYSSCRTSLVARRSYRLQPPVSCQCGWASSVGDPIDGVMRMSMTTLSQYTPLAELEGVMTLLPVLDVYCAGIGISIRIHFTFTLSSH